jgi:hypothetical protein
MLVYQRVDLLTRGVDQFFDVLFIRKTKRDSRFPRRQPGDECCNEWTAMGAGILANWVGQVCRSALQISMRLRLRLLPHTHIIYI